MAARKRYDTESLVNRLRAERRNGLILVLAAIVILVIVVVAYVVGVRGDDMPEVPGNEKGAVESPTEGSPTDTAAPGQESEEEPPAEAEGSPEPAEEEPAEEPAAGGKATVQLVLSKKGVVWLDGKKLGKFKRKTLELAAGEHSFRAKVGKKKLTATIAVKGAEKVSVTFDHKKKQPKIER